jgi:hypothetical protein
MIIQAIIIGTLFFSVLGLWNRIRDWLLNNVANYLEHKFGYSFAKGWKKSIVTVDRIIHNGKHVVRKVADLICNSEKSTQNIRMVKVVKYDSESDYTLEELEEMDKKGKLCQEYAMEVS